MVGVDVKPFLRTVTPDFHFFPKMTDPVRQAASLAVSTAAPIFSKHHNTIGINP